MHPFKTITRYGLTVSGGDKLNYYKAIFMKNLNEFPTPKNLTEAVNTLKKATPPEIIEKIDAEELDPTEGHMSMGRWLRNNWGLWAGSELKEWFERKGIRHADDMSGIILETFKREVRGQEWGLTDQITYYREYWKKKDVDPDKIGT